MKNLLLIPYPADEVFIYGGLLSAHMGDDEQTWHALVAFDRRPQSPVYKREDLESIFSTLGISRTKWLNLPALEKDLIDVADGISVISSELTGYDRIYVPDVTGSNVEGLLATITSLCFDGEVWTRTANGAADFVYASDKNDLARMIEYLNANYQNYLRYQSLDISQVQNVSAFRSVQTKSVVRFNTQCGRHTESLSPYFESLCAADPDPWDLSASLYERSRHEAELSMIAGIEWSSIVEVGACCGVFTKLLAKNFPERQIFAIEPARRFAERIISQNLSGVEVLTVPVQNIERSFDVVLMSSCIYYMSKFPANIVRNADKYVITSHRWTYEQETVYPAMKSLGWTNVREIDLPPCIETFSDFIIDKDGTFITLWERK